MPSLPYDRSAASAASAAGSRSTLARSDADVPTLGQPVSKPPKLWNEEDVPDVDSPAFRQLIFRGPEDVPDLTPGAQRKPHVFKPKDEHCGIWKDPPNQRCHASLGDRGTTASVSCFGNLVQMSQFLGAGHSGVFTIDHQATDEPYFVCDRAECLDNLARNQDDLDSTSFGLRLPEDYSPQDPPEVKWVNWRWPRYEWDTKVPGVQAHCQWVVHDNIVLQQVTLENSNEAPIRDFGIELQGEMLIRDLDYLDPSYLFNETSLSSRQQRSGYDQIGGPNGFGWITVHGLEYSRPEEKPYSNTNGDCSRASQEGPVSDLISRAPPINQDSPVEHTIDPVAPRELPNDPRKLLHPGLSQALHSPPEPEQNAQMSSTNLSQSSRYQQVGSDGQETDVPGLDGRSQLNAGAEAGDAKPAEDGMERTVQLHDTWSASKARSVACVMALYCRGKAVQMHPGSTELSDMQIGAKGSDSDVLEIVVAYRLVVLPDTKVHWKNFLVTAEQADVSRILRDETVRLWGEGEDACTPLCELGLSLIDPEKTTKKPSEPEDAESSNVGGGGGAATGDASKTADVSTDTASAPAAPGLEESQDGIDGPGHAQTPSAEADPDPKPAFGLPRGLPGTSSPKYHIEYMAWRHLEHILSVCAIPLVPCTLFNDDGDSNPGGSGDGDIIALTCGDMAGHRICTSASFFAFQFLLDALSRLKEMKDSPYIVSLRSRIDSVCQGHVRWLEWLRKPWEPPQESKSLLESGCFAANYWLSGNIMPKGSRSWQPLDSMTDTPFQILKLANYAQFIGEGDEERRDRHMSLLRDVSVPWINEIEYLDRRGMFAWPHSQDDGINTYRLDDHVWLWRSLTSLKGLGLWDYSPLARSATDGKIVWDGHDRWIRHFINSYDVDAASDQASGFDLDMGFERIPHVYRRLNPSDVQRGILQRFTIENEVSRKRMLAVTRSPRDTRFLMHARDTALFYGHDRGFFMPETSFNELWEGTIESQREHEENLEESWENVLRFSLGVVAGTRRFSLNRKNPAELATSSVLALIAASAHNGFIPGELNVASGSPALFANEEDRDYYYHVGFESSHILLVDARNIDKAFLSTRSSSPLEGKRPGPKALSEDRDAELRRHDRREMIEKVRKEIVVQPKRQKVGGQGDQPGTELDRLLLKRFQETSGRLDGQRALTMKKAMPFNNNLMDASSIVNVDEEWLYVYPAFLTTKRIDLDEQLKSIVSEFSDQQILGSAPTDTIIDQALKVYSAKYYQKGFSFSLENNLGNTVVFVANIPKQKRLSKRQKRRQDEPPSARRLDNDRLWCEIRTARSAAKAKKRFLWLPHANTWTALFCWVASTEAERPAMSLFFDRHSRFEKYLWDDTTLSRNLWQTELHLSFYVLTDKSQPEHVGLPPSRKDAFPGSSSKEIRRASMGFRFDGDFFDRYWTCHFIQHIPSLQSTPGVKSLTWDSHARAIDDTPEASWNFSFDSDGRGRYKDKHWWQRKVLELHLLQRVLDAITTGSSGILGQVRNELGVDDSFLSFSILNTEAYASSKDNWQKFEYILQTLEEDLTAILNTLQKWNSREEDRGQERPRWTRNDERKYRGYIDKFRGQTDRQMWNLEIQRDDIRKLKDKLTTSREKIRDDLEIKREENIRYFTYVTVIFLPLGFAASFFSMSGAPEGSLIVSLVKFAAAAFAVTIALLFFAKTIFAAADFVLEPMKRLRKWAARTSERRFRKTKQESLLLKAGVREYHSGETPVRGNSRFIMQSRRNDSQEDDVSHFWFWLAYISLEIPTRRILLATAVLQDGGFPLSAAGTILVGILFLPVYGMSRTIHLTAHNILSLGKIIEYALELYLSPSSKHKDATERKKESISHHFHRMTDPPPIFAPLRALEEKLRGRKVEREHKLSQDSAAGRGKKLENEPEGTSRVD